MGYASAYQELLESESYLKELVEKCRRNAETMPIMNFNFLRKLTEELTQRADKEGVKSEEVRRVGRSISDSLDSLKISFLR